MISYRLFGVLAHTCNAHPVTPIERVPDHGPIRDGNKGFRKFGGLGSERAQRIARTAEYDGLEAGRRRHGGRVGHCMSCQYSIRYRSRKSVDRSDTGAGTKSFTWPVEVRSEGCVSPGIILGRTPRSDGLLQGRHAEVGRGCQPALRACRRPCDRASGQYCKQSGERPSAPHTGHCPTHHLPSVCIWDLFVVFFFSQQT